MPVQEPDTGASLQEFPAMEAEDPVGGTLRGDGARIASRSVASSPTSGAAGRFWTSSPALTWGCGYRIRLRIMRSEASEWELRSGGEKAGGRGRRKGRRPGELGVEAEECSQFLQTPSFMASVEED